MEIWKLKSIKSIIAMGLLAFIITSCGGLAFVQYPQEFTGEGRKVTATIKRYNFLGLKPASKTYQVLEQLSKKCDRESNGKVSNITYEIVRKNYLGFVLGTEITATGYCCCLEDGEAAEAAEEEEKKPKRGRRKRK